MIRVSSTEFQRDAGRYQELALSEPVAITSEGRERVILVSAEDYARLIRRAQTAFLAEDTPARFLPDIEAAAGDER